MSGQTLKWLDKLDSIVDRAFDAEESDERDESDSVDEDTNDGSSSEDNIGHRAFARHVGRSALHADVNSIRSRLQLPNLSPKRSEKKRRTFEASVEGKFVSGERDGRESAVMSSVNPPVLVSDAMLASSERESISAEQSCKMLDQSCQSRNGGLSGGVQTHLVENQGSGEGTEEAANKKCRSGLAEVATAGETLHRLLENSSTSEEAEENSLSSLSIGNIREEEDAASEDETSKPDTGNWSNRSIEIETTHSLDHEMEDFRVDVPLPPWTREDVAPFDPNMNCHGVVHVRLLRAQKLPCPIGSPIYAVVALPPWKGKILTERAIAYRGPEQSGVAARWDQLDDAVCSSMVHSWNSEDTPVPRIKIDLMFSPLHVMDFKIGSLELTCDPLMRSPETWKRIWLPLDLIERENTKEGDVPLVLIEASFSPSFFGEEMSSPESPVAEENTCSFGPLHGLKDEAEQAVQLSSCSVSKGTSISRSLISKKQLHHLRVHSFLLPATCAVCSSVITGWKRGYHCEQCKIDCCSNCQLQVDIQIPCGSVSSRAAVDQAIQNKFDINRILSMVAPIDSAKEPTNTIDDLPTYSRKDVCTETVRASTVGSGRTFDADDGIGMLRLRVIRACVFQTSLPTDADPSDIFDEACSVRQGDHYIRISSPGAEKSARTRTVQNTGKPRFDSEEFVFSVPHYGMEYVIEIVDATTDKAVGINVLTAQGLLQWQRDVILEEEGFAAYFGKWKRGLNERRRRVLELRTGYKKGSEYFASSLKGKDEPSKSGEKPKRGEVYGWVEVDVVMEERIDRLYGVKPIEVPSVPPEFVKVDMFQVHIGRIASLFRDFKRLVNSYIYMISWKNPFLTGASLYAFLTVWSKYDSRYIGSLPVFILVLYMVRLAWIRRCGGLKSRFTRKERDARLETEKKVSVTYAEKVYRPIGRIEVSVCRGKRMRSRDLGFTGSVRCRVYWDPLRYEEEMMKQRVAPCDKTASATHDIAATSYQYTNDPVWDDIFESHECRRLNQLLPENGMFFEADTENTLTHSGQQTHSVQFPILQPIEPRGGRGKLYVASWSSSPGAVVVQVSLRVLNNLAGFDEVLGEVSIPLSDIVDKGEIRGWFHVLGVGTNQLSPVEIGDMTSGNENATGFEKRDPNEASGEENHELPQVYLHMKWHAPPDMKEEVSATDREASLVVAEEMVRMAVQSGNKTDIIGSSIGAFNTVRGLGGNVQLIQNTLGAALDVIERIRNAFNFSDPLKSSVLLLVLVALWVFLFLVPTKTLVLIGGLSQYVVTLASAVGNYLLPDKAKSTASASDDKKREDPMPVATWIANALKSLPTDEDLRKAYHWESQRFGERESAILASKKRESRLSRLWRAEWYATIGLKVQHKKESVESLETRNWYWKPVFAIVQNRRFLFWESAREFDNGESPSGRIFLAGHAGLAGLSPIESRELTESEMPLVLSIFGRGLDGQQKVTLRCDDPNQKDKLEKVIIAASVKED